MSADNDSAKRPQGWPSKFRVAANGCVWAFRTQTSFQVHLFVMVAVLVTSSFLRMEAWRWGMLILAIGGVLAAEMVNTSIETLVDVLHPDQDRRIGLALDTAAGAVLVTAITAVAIGIVAVGPPLWDAAFAP